MEPKEIGCEGVGGWKWITTTSNGRLWYQRYIKFGCHCQRVGQVHNDNICVICNIHCCKK